MDDRIIISNENINNNLFDFENIQLDNPVSSKKESEQISMYYADNWKKQWCIDFINSHNNSETILFSALGYDLISQESQEQLAEAIQNNLQLNLQTIRRQFSHRYISTCESFVGVGETFHSRIDSDVYSSYAVKIAAYVLYKPTLEASGKEKSDALIQW